MNHNKLNKKGVEGLPWRFLVIALLIVVSIGLSLYEIERFQEIRRKKRVHKGIEDLANKMEMLKKTSDYGSFDRVELTLSKDSRLEVRATTNALIYNNKEYNLPGNVTKGIEIEKAGSYEIPIYYGPLTRELQNRSDIVVFK